MLKTILTRPVILLLLLLSGGRLEAQSAFTDFTDIRPKQNSPLSRFGIGDPLDQVHAAQAGMGALQSVYQDGYHLNIMNPASLANLSATSFEVGLYARNAFLNDASGSVSTWQGNLSYLALGFPLRNPVNLSLDQLENSWNGGMAFSLAPTTLVGYDLRLEVTDPVLGTSSNNLKGTGGTYRFTWSTAGRYRGLSVGANVNYNFGKITNNRIVAFDSIPEALASEFLEEFSVGGFSLGYGLQYAFHFGERDDEGRRVLGRKRIIVGVNGTLGNDIETEASILNRRFSPNGALFVSDTLLAVDGQLGSLSLPSVVSFGLAYEEIDKFFVGVEYGRRSATTLRNGIQAAELAAAGRVAVGVQYIPEAASYNDYWKRVRYRLGLRLEEDPRRIEGEQARRNAVTIGAGFPIRLPRQQVSFLDLAIEYGKSGVPDVLDSDYVQLTLGFSLNDNSWFFKRKLN